MPPSSLHGRMYGVFRKKRPVSRAHSPTTAPLGKLRSGQPREDTAPETGTGHRVRRNPTRQRRITVRGALTAIIKRRTGRT